MRLTRSVVFWLVAVNSLIFGLQSLLPPLGQAQWIWKWGLSASGLESGALWQFITHAFLHGNIWHLLVNMLSLWFAGRIVETEIGGRRFLALYLLSAIGGGLGQLLLGPSNTELIGASGAVCGVLLAFTTMFHDNEIIALLFFVLPVRLKAKYLGWGIVGITLLALIFHVQSWIGHAAHLGGAVTGYLFARAMGFGPQTLPERLFHKLRAPRF